MSIFLKMKSKMQLQHKITIASYPLTNKKSFITSIITQKISA